MITENFSVPPSLEKYWNNSSKLIEKEILLRKLLKLMRVYEEQRNGKLEV